MSVLLSVSVIANAMVPTLHAVAVRVPKGRSLPPEDAAVCGYRSSGGTADLPPPLELSEAGSKRRVKPRLTYSSGEMAPLGFPESAL